MSATHATEVIDDSVEFVLGIGVIDVLSQIQGFVQGEVYPCVILTLVVAIYLEPLEEDDEVDRQLVDAHGFVGVDTHLALFAVPLVLGVELFGAAELVEAVVEFDGVAVALVGALQFERGLLVLDALAVRELVVVDQVQVVAHVQFEGEALLLGHVQFGQHVCQAVFRRRDLLQDRLSRREELHFFESLVVLEVDCEWLLFQCDVVELFAK